MSHSDDAFELGRSVRRPLPPRFAGVAGMGAGELLADLRSVMAQANRLEARKHAVLSELFAVRDDARLARAESARVFVGDWDELVAEAGAVLQVGRGTAGAAVHRSLDLRERLPRVFVLFSTGRVTVVQVREVLRAAVAILDDDVLREFDHRMAHWLWITTRDANVAITGPAVADIAKRILVEIDIDAVPQVPEKKPRYGIDMHSRADGTVDLEATISKADGIRLGALIAPVMRTVCRRDGRTIGEKQVAALMALAEGYETLGCRCGDEACEFAERRPRTGAVSPDLKALAIIILNESDYQPAESTNSNRAAPNDDAADDANDAADYEEGTEPTLFDEPGPEPEPDADADLAEADDATEATDVTDSETDSGSSGTEAGVADADADSDLESHGTAGPRAADNAEPEAEENAGCNPPEDTNDAAPQSGAPQTDRETETPAARAEPAADVNTTGAETESPDTEAAGARPPDSAPPPTPSPPSESTAPETPRKPGGAVVLCGESGISGPVTAQQGNDLIAACDTTIRALGRRDPDTGEIHLTGATGYTPTQYQLLVMRLTYPTCVFPGCGVPSTGCQADHVGEYDHRHPAQGGQTTVARKHGPGNLVPLCGFHHRIKTETGWLSDLLDDGTVEWRHPAGGIWLVPPCTNRDLLPGLGKLIWDTPARTTDTTPQPEDLNSHAQRRAQARRRQRAENRRIRIEKAEQRKEEARLRDEELRRKLAEEQGLETVPPPEPPPF